MYIYAVLTRAECKHASNILTFIHQLKCKIHTHDTDYKVINCIAKLYGLVYSTVKSFKCI